MTNSDVPHRGPQKVSTFSEIQMATLDAHPLGASVIHRIEALDAVVLRYRQLAVTSSSELGQQLVQMANEMHNHISELRASVSAANRANAAGKSADRFADTSPCS